MSETCAPPPEHRHHEWHWFADVAGKYICVWWFNGSFRWGYCRAKWINAENGWRYVGPAIPPEEPR